MASTAEREREDQTDRAASTDRPSAAMRPARLVTTKVYVGPYGFVVGTAASMPSGEIWIETEKALHKFRIVGKELEQYAVER